MDIAAILFNVAEPFEHILNIFLTEGPMWNTVKIAQGGSEKKLKKTHTILYMYITGGGEEGQEQMTPREQNFDCNQKMLLL